MTFREACHLRSCLAALSARDTSSSTNTPGGAETAAVSLRLWTRTLATALGTRLCFRRLQCIQTIPLSTTHPPVSGPQLALRCIPFIFPLAVPPVPQAPADQCGMWVLTLPSGQSPAHSQPSFMLFRPHDVTLPQHATDHIKFSPPTALTRHRRTQVKTPVTWTHLFSPGLTVCHIPNPGSRIPISSNACTLIPYVLSTDSLPSIRAMDRP